jgi:hypothetical protein
MIRSDGKGTQSGARQANSEDYANLRIPSGANGLVASMLFIPATVGRIPSDAKMIHRLSNEAQLRDINKNRECFFEVGTESRVRLLPTEVQVKAELISTLLVVNGHEVRVVIEELAQRVDENFGPCAPNGLLLCGAKAIYENSLFDLQAQPETRWIRGRATCPGIDQLIRDYDRLGPVEGENDSRLVDRDRSGLSKTHPFRIALAGQISPLLGSAIRAIRESRGNQQAEGEELRKKLRVLSKAVQHEMNALLEEDEFGEGGTEGGGFRVIPGGVRVLVGSNFSVSVISPRTNEDGIVNAVCGRGLMALGGESKWRPRGESGESIQTLRFQSTSEGDFQILISLGGEERVVQVRALLEVDEEQIEYSPLRFEKNEVSSRPERNKYLEIIGPIGIDVLSLRLAEGEAEIPVDVTLDPSSDGNGMRGGFRVSLPSGEQKVVIGARPVGSSEEILATINARESDSRGLGAFKFEVKNVLEGNARSTTVPGEPKTVVAYGKHPANRQSLGAYDEANNRFFNEAEPEAVRMLAELFSYELAKYVVEQKAQQQPDDFDDAAQIMAKHADFAQRLVTVALAALAETDR